MDDRKLLEQIDACRAGTEDLASPEMTELARQMDTDPRVRQAYERIQQFDQRFAARLADAPLPEGLEARLLARLAADRDTSRAADEPAATVAAEPDQDSTSRSAAATVRPSSRLRRRRAVRFWPAWVAAAAAAAVLVGVWLRAPANYKTIEAVLRSAHEFHDAEAHGTGRLLAEVPPPGDLPPSRTIALDQQTSWRAVDGFLGRSGRAYDLFAPGPTRATLYVVPRHGVAPRPRLAVSLPSAPPRKPALTTGGRAMAAWQEDGLVYVLVVDGDERQYGRFFTSSGPLAARPPANSRWLVCLKPPAAHRSAESADSVSSRLSSIAPAAESVL